MFEMISQKNRRYLRGRKIQKEVAKNRYYTFDIDNTLMYFLVGRYEYRVKGIDLFIKSLGILNKIAGAAFGAAKLALILSIVLIVFSKLNRTLPFVSQEGLDNSILYNPIKNLAPTLFPSILSREGDQETETNNEEI